MKPNDLIVLACAAPFILSLAAILIAAMTAPKGNETPAGFEAETDKK